MRKTILDNSVVDDPTAGSKNEPKLVRKFFGLIRDIHKHPFEGLGKPEALKYQYKGYWSPRISDEHRLIYSVHSDEIKVARVHGHYD